VCACVRKVRHDCCINVTILRHDSVHVNVILRFVSPIRAIKIKVNRLLRNCFFHLMNERYTADWKPLKRLDRIVRDYVTRLFHRWFFITILLLLFGSRYLEFSANFCRGSEIALFSRPPILKTRLLGVAENLISVSAIYWHAIRFVLTCFCILYYTGDFTRVSRKISQQSDLSRSRDIPVKTLDVS